MPTCPECDKPFSHHGEHDARSGRTFCSHECKMAAKSRERETIEPLSVWIREDVVYISFTGRIQGLYMDEAKRLQENLDKTLSEVL